MKDRCSYPWTHRCSSTASFLSLPWALRCKLTSSTSRGTTWCRPYSRCQKQSSHGSRPRALWKNKGAIHKVILMLIYQFESLPESYSYCLFKCHSDSSDILPVQDFFGAQNEKGEHFLLKLKLVQCFLIYSFLIVHERKTFQKII